MPFVICSQCKTKPTAGSTPGHWQCDCNYDPVSGPGHWNKPRLIRGKRSRKTVKKK